MGALISDALIIGHIYIKHKKLGDTNCLYLIKCILGCTNQNRESKAPLPNVNGERDAKCAERSMVRLG